LFRSGMASGDCNARGMARGLGEDSEGEVALTTAGGCRRS
jgi:hypothetical protein